MVRDMADSPVIDLKPSHSVAVTSVPRTPRDCSHGYCFLQRLPWPSVTGWALGKPVLRWRCVQRFTGFCFQHPPLQKEWWKSDGAEGEAGHDAATKVLSNPKGNSTGRMTFQSCPSKGLGSFYSPHASHSMQATPTEAHDLGRKSSLQLRAIAWAVTAVSTLRSWENGCFKLVGDPCITPLTKTLQVRDHLDMH